MDVPWRSFLSSEFETEFQTISWISVRRHQSVFLRVSRCRWQLSHTHTFNGPFSETAQVSRYHRGKINLDFTEARDSEWQWHQLGHMQVCTLLQTDNHASTPPLSFLQAGCPSCRPTNSVKALKAKACHLGDKTYPLTLCTGPNIHISATCTSLPGSNSHCK